MHLDAFRLQSEHFVVKRDAAKCGVRSQVRTRAVRAPASDPEI
jgi:hypothetical protein